MNAVIYARYSSDKQTEQSIEGQLTVCKQYAEKNGYLVVDIYIDRALSATTDKRPAFQKMLNDSKKQCFNAVIVYKLDRFARNRYDSAVYKSKLKKNGVKLVSAMENITNTPEGIILESVIEGMNEYYSMELSQKVKRGQIESIKKGHWLGGVLPFGYDVANKKLVVNESEAKIVKMIFNEYNKGVGVTEIANNLKLRGVKNKHDKTLTGLQIMSILKNVKYIGKLAYNDELYDNYSPIIINEEVFYRTQTLIKKNKRSPGRMKANVNYLLSGVLCCGDCGCLMCGESGTNKNGNTYYYYKCSGHKHKTNDCANKAIKKDSIEDLVINTTLEHMFKPDIYSSVVDKILELSNKDTNQYELQLLNNELQTKQKQLNNIVEAIKAGIFSKTTQDELLKLEDEIQKVKDTIAVHTAKAPIRITRDMVEFWFAQFRDYTSEDKKINKLIVNSFINKVFYSEHKLTIVYNHSGECTEDVTLEEVNEMCSTTNKLVTLRRVELLTPP